MVNGGSVFYGVDFWEYISIANMNDKNVPKVSAIPLEFETCVALVLVHISRSSSMMVHHPRNIAQDPEYHIQPRPCNSSC
jgi:hypothetical protein